MINADQYPIVAQRRIAYDALLWRVPTIGASGQGILIATALNTQTTLLVDCLILISAVVLGLVTIKLFQNVREFEKSSSELLEEFEAAHHEEGFHVVHGQRAKGLSAYLLWLRFLGFVIFADLAAAVIVLLHHIS